MQQSDWVGAAERDIPPPSPHVFNPAPARVDEKIQLRADLTRLTSRIPGSVANGSVQYVATWRASLAEATKVLRSPRSTGQQLRAAINSMRRFAA